MPKIDPTMAPSGSSSVSFAQGTKEYNGSLDDDGPVETMATMDDIFNDIKETLWNDLEAKMPKCPILPKVEYYHYDDLPDISAQIFDLLAIVPPSPDLSSVHNTIPLLTKHRTSGFARFTQFHDYGETPFYSQPVLARTIHPKSPPGKLLAHPPQIPPDQAFKLTSKGDSSRRPSFAPKPDLSTLSTHSPTSTTASTTGEVKSRPRGSSIISFANPHSPASQPRKSPVARASKRNAPTRSLLKNARKLSSTISPSFRSTTSSPKPKKPGSRPTSASHKPFVSKRNLSNNSFSSSSSSSSSGSHSNGSARSSPKSSPNVHSTRKKPGRKPGRISKQKPSKPSSPIARANLAVEMTPEQLKQQRQKHTKTRLPPVRSRRRGRRARGRSRAARS